MIQFSEAKENWQSIPSWVGFLIRLGYGWPSENPQPRRVALVSMPSDSAAAGLIALGALIRDLANPRANDIDGHYDRLTEYARQYLESCRHCELPNCDPKIKGCGYVEKATGVVRSPRFPRRLHHVSERTEASQGRLAFDDRTSTYWPNPQYLTDWHIDGEPPVQWTTPEGELPANRYCGLVPDAPVHAENLRKTYSGICLSGRTVGENASREMCASVRFRDGTTEYGLDELLTVHGWSGDGVSRIAFFNPRTGRPDRNVGTPRLIVADGDDSFLKAIDHPEFRKGDVVGVLHRITDRATLEAVGNKMSSLRQWYVPDEDMLCALPEVPRGISISILRRRT